MSSLAGALDQPASYSHGFSTELPPVNNRGISDEDVDMKPPRTDVLPKEEEDTVTISGVPEDKAQDEEMEDLFGNEAEETKHDAADAASDR